MRGEFNLGTLVITCIFALTVWLGVRFAQAFMDQSKVETVLSTSILQNRANPEDPEIPSKIVSEVSRLTGLSIHPENIIVFKSVDGAHIRIDVAYTVPIKINGFGFDLSMDTSASETSHRKY